MVIGILSAFAQYKVSGTVISFEDNQPIAGATVNVKGTTNSAATDKFGNFSIQNVSPRSSLLISNIGYETQEVSVGNKTSFRIQLKNSATQLENVVVTALGIEREERSLGYAVSEVKGDDLQKAREVNVVNSLAGKVPGLIVTGTAGGPAGSSRVIIRGNTSLTGNNQPLYVVDGVPMDNSNYGGAGGGQYASGYDLGDAVSAINPDDIEKVSVLKGPSAAALYGSGAANGVIMITTKRGSKKDLGIEFNSTSSIEKQLTHFEDYQYLYGHGSLGTIPLDPISSANSLFTSYGARLDPNLMVIGFDGKPHPYSLVKNNIDNFFRTGATTTNNISLAQSVDNTSLRFSVTDLRSKDIIPKSGMNRTTLNFTGRSKFGKKLSLNVVVTYMTEMVNNRPALGDSRENIGTGFIGLANDVDQSIFRDNYKTEQGDYLDWGQGQYRLNPYWVINEMTNKTRKEQLSGGITANYDFNKWVSVQGRLSAYQTRVGFEKYSAVTTPGQEPGELLQNDIKYATKQADVLVTFKKDISSSINLAARLGASASENTSLGNNMRFSNMKVSSVSPASFADKSVTEVNVRKQKNSIYGLFTASYKKVLYLDATIRQDVSSALPIKNNTYIYPSLSGSFIFSDAFHLPKVISFGKIRASVAEVGSDTDPYMLNLYYGLNPVLFNGGSFGGISTSVVPNADLKPTRTRSFEAGTVVRFLGDRIGLDFTYYTQKSRDQIIIVPSSYSSGFTRRIINAGLISNKGIEIALTSTVIEKKTWGWDVNLNFAQNVNKVESLTEGASFVSLADARWLGVSVVAQPGEAYGSILGFDYQRDPEGNVILNPVSLNPLQSSQRKILGKGTYDWTGGINSILRYKSFSLATTIDIKQGAQMYSMTNVISVMNGKNIITLPGRDEWIKSEEERIAARKTPAQWVASGSVKGYVPKGVLASVNSEGKTIYTENTRAVNPSVYWPGFYSNGNGLATPFIYDASYIKVREITLSYGIPKRITSRLGLKNLTVAVVSRNPFFIRKNIPNVDPDNGNYQNGNGQGMEYGALPSRRNWGFNLNVKF